MKRSDFLASGESLNHFSCKKLCFAVIATSYYNRKERDEVGGTRYDLKGTSYGVWKMEVWKMEVWKMKDKGWKDEVAFPF